MAIFCWLFLNCYRALIQKSGSKFNWAYSSPLKLLKIGLLGSTWSCFMGSPLLAGLGITDLVVLKARPNLRLLHLPFPQTEGRTLFMEIICCVLISTYCYHQCLLPSFEIVNYKALVGKAVANFTKQILL